MRSGKDGGFTILELLISVLLMAMVVLVAAGAIRLGFRSVEKGENKIQYHERMRAVLDIIDAQLQSEIPLQYDEDNSRKFYFRGDRWSMQFPSNHSVRGADRAACLSPTRCFQNRASRAVRPFMCMKSFWGWRSGRA